MKRNVILMFLVSLVVASLSGCILSSNPTPGSPVTLNVGSSQTYSVKGIMNSPYVWSLYKGGNWEVIPEESGPSFTYKAVYEDTGDLMLQVQTKDLSTNQSLKVQWHLIVNDIEVIDDGTCLNEGDCPSVDPTDPAIDNPDSINAGAGGMGYTRFSWTFIAGCKYGHKCYADSPNKRFRLILQGDQNLVLYDQSKTPRKALWNSCTRNRGFDAFYVQCDGNAMIVPAYCTLNGQPVNTSNYALLFWEWFEPCSGTYGPIYSCYKKKTDWPYWATWTYGNDWKGVELRIQDDGNLVLVQTKAPNKVLWLSATFNAQYSPYQCTGLRYSIN